MSDDDLTPEQESDVSRMLADAAGPLSMPAEVSSRLDDVLAGLVAERSSNDDGVVTPITAARRRRWPQVLVAAAAVSVMGYAAGTSLLNSAGGGADLNSESRAGALSNDDAGADGLGEAPEVATVPSPTFGRHGELTHDRVNDLTKALQSLNASVNDRYLAYFDEQQAARMPAEDTATKSLRCARPRLARGDESFAIWVDPEHRAVVVLRAATTGTARLAEVYPCRQPYFPVDSALVLGAR